MTWRGSIMPSTPSLWGAKDCNRGSVRPGILPPARGAAKGRPAPAAARPLPQAGEKAAGRSARASARLLRQFVPEERVVQRPHVRRLLVGGCGAVAAFGVLVVAHVLAGGEHLRGHLAGMAGVHAVVAGGGPDERRRVVLGRVEQLVRR